MLCHLLVDVFLVSKTLPELNPVEPHQYSIFGADVDA